MRPRYHRSAHQRIDRNLLNLVTVAAFIVFVAGLRAIIRDADNAYDWLASLVLSVGMVYAAINVKISLEAGGVLGTRSGTFDPTTDGPLAHANVLMHGPATRLVTALLLTAAGYAILRTNALPRWAGQSAYLLALVNLAFVPSLYFGIDPSRFYSPLGWGNTALTSAAQARLTAAVDRNAATSGAVLG